MQDHEVLNYVKATAQALSLPMDDTRAQAVAVHFGRTVQIARALDGVPLVPEHEPAEVFRPAPFPQEDA